jgi:hypothetical protein
MRFRFMMNHNRKFFVVCFLFIMTMLPTFNITNLSIANAKHFKGCNGSLFHINILLMCLPDLFR